MPIHKKYNFDPALQDSIRRDSDKLIKMVQDKEIKPIGDSWSNILTGLGQKYDKTKYTTFTGYSILDDIMLAEIWVGDGLGKKIIDCKPDDMTREWFKIKNDPDCIINNELEKLDAEFHINLALKWRALFGGGINVLLIKDGGELHEPVNKNSIKEVYGIRTYDRTDAYITEYHFGQDPSALNYGELQFLTIQPKYSAAFNVHVDRLLIWKGIPVPAKIEVGNFYYWGMSELQSGWTQLSNLGAGMDHIVKILYEFIIGKYKISGLAQLIAENNKKQVEEIMAIIELAKSTIQGVLLDTNDDYTRDSAQVSGLGDLIDRFMMMMSGAYDIPITRLFGRSAAGMNATGENDMDNYYNGIKSKQKGLKPNLNKLIEYINIALGNKVENPIIEFNALQQQSEKEKLECRKIQADTDHIYIADGVLTPDEVAENRFGGEDYSTETKIDLLHRELPESNMEEEMSNENMEEEMSNENMQEGVIE